MSATVFVPIFLLTSLTRLPGSEGVTTAGVSATPPATSNSLVPQQQNCGRNSLFMYLRLMGHDVPYSEIERCVPSSERGSSLADVRAGAGRLGVDLHVFRHERTGEAAANLGPCIAHVQQQRTPGSDSSQASHDGHYVVVERIDGTGTTAILHLIDGSFGFRERRLAGDFAVDWTGYSLSAARRWASSGLHPASFAFLGTFLALAVALYRKEVGQLLKWFRGLIRLFSTICAGAAIAGFPGIPLLAQPFDQRSADWSGWRVAGRDAVNCLYVVLRKHGIACDYDEVLTAAGQGRQLSALDLQQAAERLGLTVVPYRGTTRALSALDAPVIAHLQGKDSGDGAFCVVFPDKNAAEVLLVHGATAEAIRMSQDAFLREWTGLVLLARPADSSSWWTTGSLMGLAVVVRLLFETRLRRLEAVSDQNAGESPGGP